MSLIQITRITRTKLSLANWRQWRWPAVLAILVVAGAVYPQTALETVRFVGESLLSIAPVIFVAILFSASIRATGADELVARVFEGRRYTMILGAAFLGALTPICGVGVLPIIAGLLGAGVPLAAIMAFWLASPITDPPMLAITAGTLGLDFAVGKTLAAFGIGLVGGIATDYLLNRGFFKNPLRAQALTENSCGATCGPLPLRWVFWTETIRRRLFIRDARSSSFLIIKWLTLAFVVESVVRAYLPPEIIAQAVGAGNAWAIPLSVTIGAPVYLDGYAALPLVRGLLDLGMTPGAAMAFLVAGGITSLYASVAVFALVRWPVFVWYLALAVLCSGAAGYAFELYSNLAG